MLEFVLCSFVLEDSKYSNYDTSSMSCGVEGYDLLINVWRESIGCTNRARGNLQQGNRTLSYAKHAEEHDIKLKL